MPAALLTPTAKIALTALGDDVARAIPQADRSLADRAYLPVVSVDRGPWAPPPHDAPPRAVIVLGGALLRTVTLGRRQFGQVVDDGEILDPWHRHEGSLPAKASWHALEPVRLALLDERFERYGQRWPALLGLLQRRTAEQAARTAVHAAILSLSTVEQRLLGLLWHVADRRGRVTSDGVLVALDVTHQQLGALVGAQRSTATLALKRLGEDGHVRRRDDGHWLLSHDSRELLVAEG